MDTKRFLAMLIFLVIAAVVLPQFPLVSATESPFTSVLLTPTPLPIPLSSDEAQIALHHVSETHDIPLDRLWVGDEAIVEYPSIGKTLWTAKVGHIELRQAYLVEIDLDSGRVVDGDKIRKKESKIYRAKNGKLDPELYDHFQCALARQRWYTLAGSNDDPEHRLQQHGSHRSF